MNSPLDCILYIQVRPEVPGSSGEPPALSLFTYLHFFPDASRLGAARAGIFVRWRRGARALGAKESQRGSVWKESVKHHGAPER